MSEDLNGLLLGDRWAPVTSDMGFLETDVERAARALSSWQGGLWASEGVIVTARPVDGSLEQVLSALLPLSGGEKQRHLFIPTRSAWTAYVDNGYRGTDAVSAMSYLAQVLGCRGMRVGAVPHTLREDKGRYGVVALEVYGPRQTDWLNYLRTLYAMNDGGRWVFGQSGEPFPFEKLARYQARKVRDRFTLDILEEYLLHLGLSPFQEDFYLPQGAKAWLVEKTGSFFSAQKEYTLAQAREDF
ncbi:hypothetical protein CYFUS_004947 [Cystobacter fuscus]|uniref:Uncharacterized protein n=1 Tax=Cystobacter fuscus TaxID=43 RepID=A0A250J7B3_9BACT|nr:hypothetical protein [Cystobacter fuscus]ATB39503.1 hypothetical protein CYFUS_004947 [Cystobacter fuscus]